MSDHTNEKIPTDGENGLLVGPSATKKKPETPPSSSSFLESIKRLVMGRSQSTTISSLANNSGTSDQSTDKKSISNATALVQPLPLPKRACRAPPSRRFAHPCSCSQASTHHRSQAAHNSSSHLPSAAYSQLHLYDPHTKKCLPTSRSRDMLLKECRTNVAAPYQMPNKLNQRAPCVYDDLICDARRNRCVCKPTLHLFYESSANNSAFGCIPIAAAIPPAGHAPCRSGYIYNVISNECQKIFDVNELPPNQTASVSATQFSFVTIVLIWLLLFILIATTKLRKCRNQNLYGNSPATERRLHRAGSYRPQSQGGTTTWLYPFIAAATGHHNQHRSALDRHSQTVDDSGNFSDTDFFLSGGNRRLNELFADGAFVGSQQSLNNPPPKFEEIYPSCPEEQPMNMQLPPPSHEDLPTYDEAMKLQNTTPSDAIRKE